jgi:hypothetical protein
MAYKKNKERKKQEFLEQCLKDIVTKLRFCESVIKDIEIKKGEYREMWDEKWGDIYFNYLKESMRLDWLYYTLCGFDTKENQWTYTYGDNGTNVLKKIYKCEIKI